MSRRRKNSKCFHNEGYYLIGNRLEHVIVAERALGKPLPKGAVVHHIDGNGLNNDPKNLVICPNQAYHLLIHQRTRALKACGNANYRKCYYCQCYDNPKLMALNCSNRCYHHRECFNKASRLRHKKAPKISAEQARINAEKYLNKQV